MYEKGVRLLIKILLIGIIISAGLTLAFTGTPLSFVVDSCMTNEAIYIIDDNGEVITIYQTNENGDRLAAIQELKTSGDQVTSFDYLMADGSNIYVYKIVKSITSNTVLSEEIYRCDFNRNALELAWSLPILDQETQNNFSPSIQKGVLRYFTVGYDAQNFTAQAILNEINTELESKVISYIDYDLGISFTDFFYSDHGDIVFTTPEGKVFKGVPPTIQTTATVANETVVEVDAILPNIVTEVTERTKEDGAYDPLAAANQLAAEQIFPLEDASGGIMTGFTTDGKHTLYFINTTTQTYQSYDLETDMYRDAQVASSFVGNELVVESYDLKNTRFYDETTYTASINQEANKGGILLWKDSIATLIYEIQKSDKEILLTGVWCFLGYLAVITMIYLIRGIFLLIMKGKVPIVTKVVGVCVPVIILSVLILQMVINTIFVNQIVDNQYKELLLISSQQKDALSTQLLSEIDLENPYDDIYYYELRSILNALPSSSEIYELDNNQSQTVYDFGYHWLYIMDEGQLKSLYCGQNYINVPIDYYYDQETVSMFYNATQQNKIVRGSFRDVGGEWTVLAIPIVDDLGNVVGVMESGTTKTSLEYAVNENTKIVNWVNTGIMLLLAISLSVLVVICLKPLKYLKDSVGEIIKGNLGVQTKIQGHDEVAEIGQVFNQMSRSVEVSVNELTTLNEGYYKFVPSKMFDLLKKSSVTDVRLGDQVNLQITVLTVNGSDFEQVMSSMTSDTMFPLINGMYSTMVPIVGKHEGVVDKFEQAGLVAFFTENCANAIDAAVTVAQKITLFNRERKVKDLPIIEISSGICYGRVMVGIVGHDQRLSATTISEYTNLSNYLRELAHKYGTSVMVTGTIASQISDFHSRYHVRYLGYIYLSSMQMLEKIYDVYDGDLEQLHYLKDQTKELFERGVDLYVNHEFYEARLVFIEVLKKNRNDAAAKEYLYLCDQYYRLDNQQDIEIYIETY